MSKAVLCSFHNYVPMYDHKYFNVISDYFIDNFNKYWADEIDCLYLLDSNWDLEVSSPKIRVIKSDPNLRYYDAYKKVLPEVRKDIYENIGEECEDKIMFMDNDMVVYRKGVVEKTFDKLKKYDVVSIYDSCGTYKTDKLNGKNKFCPYWFAVDGWFLKKFLHIEWGPEMPVFETFGRLTKHMLDNGAKAFEIEEDKTNEGKDLGYYHIRGGSTPAYLLTHRNFGNRKTYDDYLKNQPMSETLRLCDWYDKMGGDTSQIRQDINA